MFYLIFFRFQRLNTPWFSTIETRNQSVNCCDKPISCSIHLLSSHATPYHVYFFYNCNFRQALFNDCLCFCLSFQMTDFPDSTQHVSPSAASLIENFQKKNATPAGNSISTNTARQNFLNSNSSLSSSSVKATSTSSQVSFFFDICGLGSDWGVVFHENLVAHGGIDLSQIFLTILVLHG